MVFTSRHKIRFDDVDGAGIVYYPKFFHLCHDAMEDFFDAATPIPYAELIGRRKLGFPTVAVESSFTAPLSYGDTAVITLEVERLGRASVVFAYRFRREADDVECFRARVTTVLMDLGTRRAVPITAELRTILEGLVAG